MKTSLLERLVTLKISWLVNCKSFRLSRRLFGLICDSAAILTSVFESLMTMVGVDWVAGGQIGTEVGTAVVRISSLRHSSCEEAILDLG